MKALLFTISLTIALLGLALAVNAQAPTPASSAGDPIVRAMRDEINRSLKLTVPNLEAPYFIQYLIDEAESFGVSATLGGLTGRRNDRFRNLDVSVRVGDYKFDNSNYVGSDFNFGSHYDLERFPLDGDRFSRTMTAPTVAFESGSTKIRLPVVQLTS